MNHLKIICSLLLSLAFTAWAKSPTLKDILKLKLGDQLGSIKESYKLNEGDYEITSEKGAITSITINFNQPVKSSLYIKPHDQGYCLIQPYGGDVMMNHVFFFDIKSNIRYEFNPFGEIINILKQDIPGAKLNKACKFSELKMMEKNKPQLKKIK